MKRENAINAMISQGLAMQLHAPPLADHFARLQYGLRKKNYSGLQIMPIHLDDEQLEEFLGTVNFRGIKGAEKNSLVIAHWRGSNALLFCEGWSLKEDSGFMALHLFTSRQAHYIMEADYEHNQPRLMAYNLHELRKYMLNATASTTLTLQFDLEIRCAGHLSERLRKMADQLELQILRDPANDFKTGSDNSCFWKMLEEEGLRP